MVLKSYIQDAAYFAFRRAQIKGLETDRLDCIHVSDLISPCMRNVIYSKITPEKSSTTEDMKFLYFGQCLHANSNMASKPEYHEMKLLYNWVTDAEQLIVMKENKWDYIAGSIDDIIEVDGELIICDKKTTGSIDYFSPNSWNKGTPRANEGHKLQTNMYRVLLNKCKKLDAKWGCNIYIDNCVSKDKKDKPSAIAYKLQDPEETLGQMVQAAEIIKEAMTEGVLPERTKNYLCDGVCPHSTKCFTDDRKKWNE